jgi:hypothetical protein
LGWNDGISCLDQALGHMTELEILVRAQDREIEARNFDPRDLVAATAAPSA